MKLPSTFCQKCGIRIRSEGHDPTCPGDDSRPAHCSLDCEHYEAAQFTLFICRDKDDVQRIFERHHGYLSSDMTDVCWVRNGVFYMAIRRDATPGRIAHESTHIALRWMKLKKLDPNDFSIHRPKKDDPDYGFVPAELVAELVEQIVDFCVAEISKANA